MLFRNLNKFGLLNRKNLMKIKYSSHSDKEVKIKEAVTRKSIINSVEYEQDLTPDQKKTMKRFDIYRYNPEEEENSKVLMSYYLNLKDCGPMVLDALIKVKDEVDSTLTFRRYYI